MDPFKALCFLSEGEQNSWCKRRCIASAVDVNGQYRLLTKDEDKKKNLIFKRFSRGHFGRYAVEACFFKEFGEFTLLKIKGTPQDNGGNLDMHPLNLELPSSENLKALTSPCATEKFKFKFKCDGERGTIELICEEPLEETSIVGAPIIIEQSGRFSVIGVVGLTSEKQLCPCYLNKSILAKMSQNQQEPRERREESRASRSLQFQYESHDYHEDSEEHVFISYHWKYEKTMWKLKTGLESDGFCVWMDVDEETIEQAVGKSSSVLIAMSREYESSPKCRKEAECAYNLGKKVFPLLMEDYEPDGFLKSIVERNRPMHFEEDASGGRHQRLKEITNTTAADLGIFLQFLENRPLFSHRD